MAAQPPTGSDLPATAEEDTQSQQFPPPSPRDNPTPVSHSPGGLAFRGSDWGRDLNPVLQGHGTPTTLVPTTLVPMEGELLLFGC